MQAAYGFPLQATGGTPPYTWSVLGSSLPAGLSLSPASGIIAGIPTVSGTFTLNVQVSDSAGDSTSAPIPMTIATPPTPPPTALFGHVLLVVEENHNYASVVGSSSMPYLNSLINQFGLATQYYANTHPSIGNYFTLTTGQILTNDDGQTPSSFPVSSANIASLLQAAGKTWKDYPETSGTYYVRHDPLQYMTNINKANLASFSQFKTDLANHALPNFSWITPNGCNDAHDCGLSTADSWLQSNIDPLVKSTYFQPGGDGLLIIVFDENSGSGGTNSTGTTAGGQVECVIVSPNTISAGFQSTTRHYHESLLRLMEQGLGLTTFAGSSASANNMSEFFGAGTTSTVSLSPTSLTFPNQTIG